MLLAHGTVMICVAVRCECALPGVKSFASKLKALQDRRTPQQLMYIDLTASCLTGDLPRACMQAKTFCRRKMDGGSRSLSNDLTDAW